MTEHFLRHTPRSFVIRGAVLTTVAACCVLTACSSGGGTPASADGTTSSATATASSNACVNAATAAVAPYQKLPTTLPTALTQLASKPKPGMVIKLTNGAISGDIAAGQAIGPAATAAGWTSENIVYNGTIEDMNQKYLQAIAQHPTAIIASGPPAAAVESSLAAAKKAGIITVLLGAVDTPGKGNDLTGVTEGAAAFTIEGQINAQWMLKDSGCSSSAQVLVATLPYPALAASQAGFASVIKQELPSLKITTTTVQPTDLGSPAATNAIVSAIQANPSIKYVYSVVGSTADGLPAALKAAGITGVKIFGSVPDAQSLEGLQNGTMAWWVTQDAKIGAWLQLDTVLRIEAAGGAAARATLSENAQPLGVLTPSNVSKSWKQLPSFPGNYPQLFAALWHNSAS